MSSNGNGWATVPLGDLCCLINGKAFKPSDWSKSGLPIIRIQNLNDATKSFNFWSGAPSGQVMIKRGDVLLGWSGTPGTSFGAHHWCREEGVLNQHIFRVDLDESRIAKEWAVPAINHQLEALIGKAHGGVGLRHVKKGEVESLPIPLPPLAEQKRIAGILKDQLAAVERARAAAEAQLAAAQALPAAYLRNVFSAGNLAAWPTRPLGEVCKIVAKQVNPTLPEYRDLPHVNGENIESGTCRLLWLNSAAEDGMESGKYLFEGGDILYSKLRPYLRKVVLAPCRGVCSADMYPIEVDQAALNPEFAAWMLLSDQFTSYADEESRRARMPKLNREQLFSWDASFPDLVEQRKLVLNLRQQMKAAGDVESTLRKQLKNIEALPAALLRAAFQGKL